MFDIANEMENEFKKTYTYWIMYCEKCSLDFETLTPVQDCPICGSMLNIEDTNQIKMYKFTFIKERNNLTIVMNDKALVIKHNKIIEELIREGKKLAKSEIENLSYCLDKITTLSEFLCLFKHGLERVMNLNPGWWINFDDIYSIEEPNMFLSGVSLFCEATMMSLLELSKKNIFGYIVYKEDI